LIILNHSLIRKNKYVKKAVQIKNQSGLHARPVSEFVALATKFDSEIRINKVNQYSQVADAKSIIFILSLGIRKGSMIEISAEGKDEIEAVDQLVALINSGFWRTLKNYFEILNLKGLVHGTISFFLYVKGLSWMIVCGKMVL